MSTHWISNCFQTWSKPLDSLDLFGFRDCFGHFLGIFFRDLFGPFSYLRVGFLGGQRRRLYQDNLDRLFNPKNGLSLAFFKKLTIAKSFILKPKLLHKTVLLSWVCAYRIKRGFYRMNCFLSHKIDLNREMSDIIDVTRGLSVYDKKKEKKFQLPDLA